MRLLLPTHPEDVRDTKVGDLQVTADELTVRRKDVTLMTTHLDMSPSVQKQILRLDIPVRHTHRMQILDTLQDLLETAFDFADAHVALFDGSVKISTWTILHDFTTMVLFVLNEVDGLDDIGVVQGGRDAEFRSELLDVFLFRLVLSSLSEFL